MMDFPIENILSRLRKMRLELCCKHIDQQIEHYVTNQKQPQQAPSQLQTASQATTTSTNSSTKQVNLNPNSNQINSNYNSNNNNNNNSKSDLKTIECLLSNIKHLEKYDSEATESTSSDDSYDELEEFSLEDIPPKKKISFKPNQIIKKPQLTLQQQPTHHNLSSSLSTVTPISNQDYSNLKRKAIWKWANERSKLACRWTWLQAQVADLEFRIRGQNDATMHARSYKTPALPPISPETSCSRTVAMNKDFRRRRLIKASQILNESNKKLVRYSHIPCICSSLPQTVAPCLSCNGRYNYLRQIDEENLPTPERISILDPCCHTVLSFPDDLTLGFQLNYLLKQETINRKPTKGRPGRKKGSTAANLAAAAAAKAAEANSEDGKQLNKKGKYANYGLVGRPPGSQSQSMITSNKLKRKYRKHSTNTNNYANWPIGPGYHQRSSMRRNKRIRRASSMNESSNHSESSNHYRPNHFLNSNNSSAQNVSRRRRSEQSAYDIDNIVIPFSIAATTRVEILEYKEIVTPSWRVWENGTSQNEPISEEIEDTSDEAYISRHSKGESEEKKRFALKPPKNTQPAQPPQPPQPVAD